MKWKKQHEGKHVPQVKEERKGKQQGGRPATHLEERKGTSNKGTVVHEDGEKFAEEHKDAIANALETCPDVVKVFM